jgi:hypothetical protein
MQQTKLTKGLTLLSFVTLISAFLLYRVGWFDRYLQNNNSAIQTSHNGGTINTPQNDTLKPIKDTTQKLLLSSSKSVVLTDRKYGFIDSYLVKKKYIKPKPAKTEMLSSSKSAIIFHPDEPSINLDSIIRESIKIKLKTKQ